MAEKKKSTNNKKNTSNSKKTVSKTTAPKKTQKKKEFDSTNILKIIFAILVVVVIVLSVIVIKKKQEMKGEIKSNIVVPIVSKEQEAPFSVNLRALNESKKEYIFKVTNYSGNKINSEDVNYVIDVRNTTDTKIELTKYGSDKNLLTGQEDETIQGESLSKDEKEADYYVVKIVSAGELTKDDYVNIKVRTVK